MTSHWFLPRARNILVNPRREWPLAAAESDSVGGVFRRYVLVMAALPTLAQFIGESMIGDDLLGFELRRPWHAGLLVTAIEYAVSLLLVYAVAWMTNVLAPRFGARADLVQAVKLIAYAWTAAWIAGIAMIVPWLGWPISLAGVIYSIYLLYVGLPYVMHCNEERSAGFAATLAAATVVLWALAGTLVSGVGTMVPGLHGLLEPQLTDVASTIAQSRPL